GVAVDGAGNLFITQGNRVRKISSEGIISTIAGGGSCGEDGDCDPLGDGGPAVGARVGATALATDSAGNLYLADIQATDFFCENRIRKVSADGVITTLAG